jgi:predicted nucleic acid-binding Zn ribbon protein
MSRGSHRQRWQWIATRSATAADCSATQFGQSAFFDRTVLTFMAHSLRRRVLQEWRGLPEPEQKADRLLPIRDVLNQLAPKLGLEARLREEEIISAWVDIVGDFFAKHSRPIKLHQGMLVVHVLQPTVLYELERQWKSLVLQKLQARFGGKLIRDLRFRLG